MFEIMNYSLFVLTAITLNLYPGPDTLYIISRSCAQGRMAGVVSALGIGCGAIIHSLLGAMGLSALIAASATAFHLVKWAGAAYLVYLGLTMIFADKQTQEQDVTSTLPVWRIFRQGLLTNVLNPKVALFFLALIPQFIVPNATHPGLAFLLLGLTFVFTGTTWSLIVAVAAGALRRKLTGNGHGAVWLKRIGGGTLAVLGARLAVAD